MSDFLFIDGDYTMSMDNRYAEYDLRYVGDGFRVYTALADNTPLVEADNYDAEERAVTKSVPDMLMIRPDGTMPKSTPAHCLYIDFCFTPEKPVRIPITVYTGKEAKTYLLLSSLGRRSTLMTELKFLSFVSLPAALLRRLPSKRRTQWGRSFLDLMYRMSYSGNKAVSVASSHVHRYAQG